MKIMDKNNNGVADKFEGYLLLVFSAVLVLSGLFGAGAEWFSESFAQVIIVIGMAGLLGDEVIKQVILRRGR